jgi:ABC-type Mn2+/Zn2+ transport system ATPase subunit
LPTTIGEFVTLGLVGLRSVSDRRERFDWALEHAGLTTMQGRSYWQLSGGQRQRAMLARALIRRPRLLVLDEPTTGLDPAAERTFLDLVHRLNEEEGITLLFVSHRLDTARAYATRSAIVQGGTIQVGAPDSLLTDEAVAAAYEEGQR